MKNNSQSGLIKLIILVVAIVIILSYFGINIQNIAESKTGRANFGYVWQIVLWVWDWLVGLYQQYLSGTVNSAWEAIKNVVK